MFIGYKLIGTLSKPSIVILPKFRLSLPIIAIQLYWGGEMRLLNGFLFGVRRVSAWVTIFIVKLGPIFLELFNRIIRIISTNHGANHN